MFQEPKTAVSEQVITRYQIEAGNILAQTNARRGNTFRVANKPLKVRLDLRYNRSEQFMA